MQTQASKHLTWLSGKFTWDLPGTWGYIIRLSFLCDIESSVSPLLLPAGMEWLEKFSFGPSRASGSRIIPSCVVPTSIFQEVRGSRQVRLAEWGPNERAETERQSGRESLLSITSPHCLPSADQSWTEPHQAASLSISEKFKCYYFHSIIEYQLDNYSVPGV